MNKEVDDNSGCIEQREYLSLLLNGEILAPEENDSCNQHLKKCDSCNLWYGQHQSIMARAKDLPMFDVQEQLTQKILSRTGTNELGLLSVLPALALLLGGALYLYWQNYDTVSGFVSWSVGILCLFIFKLAISKIDYEKNSF